MLNDEIEDAFYSGVVQLEPLPIYFLQQAILNSTMSEDEKSVMLYEVEEPLTQQRLSEIRLRLELSKLSDNGVPYRQTEISKQLSWIQNEYKG